MFEYHGWAVISEAVNSSGESDERLSSIVSLVEERVVRLRRVNRICSVERLNGTPMLWIAGEHNHADPDVADFFRWLSGVAPGAHGLLYVRDDEDHGHDNEYRAWVLARGCLNERSDPFLSPCTPTIEDPWRPA